MTISFLGIQEETSIEERQGDAGLDENKNKNKCDSLTTIGPDCEGERKNGSEEASKC